MNGESVNRRIGSNIRYWRLRAGWDAQKLAAAIKLDVGRLAAIEVGTTRVAAGELYDIAKAIGCRLSDFLDDRESPK